jgi:hypothetical protein
MRARGNAAVLSLLGALAAIQPGLAQPAGEPQPAAADHRYTISLASYVPIPGQVAGLLLKARINGGAPLRMLLDSGATHVVVDSRAASRTALSASSALVLVGLGTWPPSTVREGRAETVAVGDLEFRDCVVDVAPSRLSEGIDGVIPTALFSGFLLHLDLPAKTLELAPFPDGSGPRPPGFAPFVAVKNLLFVPGVLNQTQPGYVLLDTGASYSAISRGVARSLRSSLGEPVRMQGSAGEIEGERVQSGVRFQVAGREFRTDPVVALDLTTPSKYNGVEIAGLLGYPDLRNSVLTIDYRDSLVKIEPKAERRR